MIVDIDFINQISQEIDFFINIYYLSYVVFLGCNKNNKNHKRPLVGEESFQPHNFISPNNFFANYDTFLAPEAKCDTL
jgi:hypothetical protein